VNNIGPTEVGFPQLVNGAIDAYPDYRGTLLAYLSVAPMASRAAGGDGARTTRMPP
jgi:glycine betaine/choline ABC-type transport system substrate-binding protein